MVHGGSSRSRLEERRPPGRRPKGLGPAKDQKISKHASLKNLIRSTERLLRKDLPGEVRQAQEKKLEELKRQQDTQSRLALVHKMRFHDKRIKFFERRKIERMIRRLEKQQCTSPHHASDEMLEQLSKLREDLDYIRFFPKTERYVPLFVGDNPDAIERRNKLRDQIKGNLIAAAAKGKDLEETASDMDALDVSEDDFFLSGSCDEADADDEWTDKSTRESAPSDSAKATSGVSSDNRNQKHIPARANVPVPHSLQPSRKRHMQNVGTSTSRNTMNGKSAPFSKRMTNEDSGQQSNLTSSLETHKPRRKRRPKKKKQATCD